MDTGIVDLLRKLKVILKLKVKTIDWRFVKSPKFYFPLLAIILIFLSLVVVFISSQQRKSLYQKAAFEEKIAREEEIKQGLAEPKISEWVPIDLNWFNQTHDEEINSLQVQLSSLDKETLSSVDKERKKDTLQRSVQIYQIEKEEYNLMDENKDGKIDFPEFNKRTVAVYSRTYSLKHQKVKDKKDGLYDEKWNLLNEAPEGTGNILYVIVEAGIYDQIKSSLDQYKADVERENKYKVGFFPCNGCTKEQIRKLLVNPASTGVIMVGDLPLAWFKDSMGTEVEYVYPVDLYYMDTDGVWEGGTTCLPWWKTEPVSCYTTHQGNINQEIIFGRLVSPTQDREIELLTNYFRKNHNYRTGSFVVPFRSLNYLQNNGEAGYRWVEAISHVFPEMDTVDLPVSSKADFLSRWQTGYENLFVTSHAGGTIQFFPDGIVTYVDVRDNRPRFNFYAFDGCSVADYTEENCIGLWYVFQDSSYGLGGVGTTTVNCVGDYDVFYNALAESKDLGEAFKAHYSGHTGDSCFSGYTLLGDPTLKIVSHGPFLSPTPIGPAKDSRCGEQCKPGYFCRCLALPREGETGQGGCSCVKE